MNAMKGLKDVSSYVKVHGYFTDELPTATEAINEWKQDGRRVYGEPKAKCCDIAPKACWPCAEFEQ